jgi:hypothetical protein
MEEYRAQSRDMILLLGYECSRILLPAAIGRK